MKSLAIGADTVDHCGKIGGSELFEIHLKHHVVEVFVFNLPDLSANRADKVEMASQSHLVAGFSGAEQMPVEQAAVYEQFESAVDGCPAYVISASFHLVVEQVHSEMALQGHGFLEQSEPLRRLTQVVGL